MFWDTFLNILAVIGIVAVGAIIVYFIANLILMAFHKESNTNNQTEATGRPVVKEEEPEAEIVAEQTTETEQAWDDKSAEEEQLLANDESSNIEFDAEAQKADETQEDFDSFDDIFGDDNSKDEIGYSAQELEEMIETINNESLAVFAAEQGTTSVEQVQETFELEGEEVAEPEQTAQEEETEKEEEIEEELDYDEEKSEIEQEKKEIEEAQAEIEKAKADLEAQRKMLEDEIKRLEELKSEQTKVVVVDDLNALYAGETLEQLEARLEILNERLKENKKDLRENKKEFNPLARVVRTLEKDKAKLTRKEAIVARQKVILYGVNNYVEIDEEKAKKLNEEMDLLDGLRLSVKHCEEVIEANKDRYPILAKTNKILTKINAEILSDIAEVEKAIEILKAKAE